ncbi:MAG: fatty-acyl-CoA synthase [Saprospiraceae bacterium]|jgi:fatty-acyl-CoA synthase
MQKQLSYLCGISNEPLLGITIGDSFDQSVSEFPDHEAVVSIHQSIRLTYSELKSKVDQCARALIALEIEKGDRVGIWSPNCVEWLIVQIATAKIGVILVNINPSYRLHELEYALHQSGCKAIVAAGNFKHSDYSQMIRDLVPEIMESKDKGLVSRKLPELRYVISLSAKEQEGFIMWEAFLTEGSTIDVSELVERQSSLTFDEAINIQYTSGTTGHPKGATLSHHNILNNGYLVAQIQSFNPEDRLVIPVPLYHCFGMVMGNLGCITHGATIIYAGPSFDPEEVLSAIQEEKATALYGVPTMFYAELHHPNFHMYDMSSLRKGVMAGSLCPSELMKRVNQEMNISDMQIAYGMTETSPVSTQTRQDTPFDKRVSTVGSIMPHTELKVINPETKQVVPIGEKGELCTRGYCVMLGYWNDPGMTAEAIDEARWMHTGDLATIDEDGYVSIVGRIKDMIIRGGENVYPKEIEEFLAGHEAIENVQVVGLPDPKFGEEICAWIQLRKDTILSEEDVKQYCKYQISHFKVPRYYRFVNEFPMTVTGKIRKVEMRKQMIEALGLGD